MEKRYDNDFVNNVFKENILLTLSYLDGQVKNKEEISWESVTSPFTKSIVLKPGETFAFDDKLLPQYEGKVSKTTNAHFISNEGYKSDGLLVGDGVCHLASIIYWSAKDASLDVLAPRNHDFAKINEVPREYGVSIMSSDPNQNLYITNNKEKDISIVFKYDGSNLSVKIIEG